MSNINRDEPSSMVLSVLVQNYSFPAFLADEFNIWAQDRSAGVLLDTIDTCPLRMKEKVRQALSEGGSFVSNPKPQIATTPKKPIATPPIIFQKVVPKKTSSSIVLPSATTTATSPTTIQKEPPKKISSNIILPSKITTPDTTPIDIESDTSTLSVSIPITMSAPTVNIKNTSVATPETTPSSISTPTINTSLDGRFVMNSVTSLGRPLFVFLHDYPQPTQDCHQALYKALKQNWPLQIYEKLKKDVEKLMNECSAHLLTSGLTNNEGCAIAYYTSEVEGVANIYSQLNQQLIGRSFPEIWKDYLYYLCHGLEKLPDVQGKVYRGARVPLTAKSSQYVTMNQIIWVAFTSTSKSDRTLKAFSEEKEKKGTWMSLNILHGKSISYFSLFPKEEEVLLMPNTYLVVKDVMSKQIKELAKLPLELDYMSFDEVDPPLFNLSQPPPQPSQPTFVPPPSPQHIRMLTMPNPFYILQTTGNVKQMEEWIHYVPQGFNPNIKNEYYNDEPLLYACAKAENGSLSNLVSYLIQHQASVNAVQKVGSTALHVSVYRGHVEVVKILLSHGADWRLKNGWKKTPMDELTLEIQTIKGMDYKNDPKAMELLGRLEQIKSILEVKSNQM